MRRREILAGLVLALFCLVLAARVAQAEEEVTVKPKGPTFPPPKHKCGDKADPGEGTTSGEGFEWIDIKKDCELRPGKPGEFRCEFNDHLSELKAIPKGKKEFAAADAAMFHIDGKDWLVQWDEESKKYIWTFPDGHNQASCIKGKNCDKDGDGIPPGLMRGEAPWELKAKFKNKPDFEEAEEIYMKGGPCPDSAPPAAPK